MYILLNFSRKTDCFNLYTNCLNPLIKSNELAYIDLTKEVDDVNMDFEIIRRKVEAALSSASAGKFSFIVLYDFEMQRKEPLVYSITGMLNNIQNQIIMPIRTNYAIDMIYFIVLDDMGRGFNGEIVDENIKKNLEFDKKGYIDDIDNTYFVSTKDVEFINDGLNVVVKKYQEKSGQINVGKAIDEFDEKYLGKIKNRIIDELDNDIPKNDEWYGECIKIAFKGYKDELVDFFNKVNKNEKNFSDIGFSIRDYLKDNIASYTNIQQNKIFRLNMHDKEGHSRRDEIWYINYYKIIAFIIYLVTEEKKYLFGGAFIKKQNHYYVDVEFDRKVIEKTISDFNNNIEYELNKLGEVKFSEVEVEEFEKSKIESNIIDKKKYLTKKVKFSLLKNDADLIQTREFVDDWGNRYNDQVEHCNKRLRNVSDILRIKMLKDFTGKKKQVTVNELYQIKEKYENKIGELKEVISSNTPEDIIQPDYSMFEVNEKYKAEADKLLNQRITLSHFIFNSLIILFISLIVFFLFRRFRYEIYTSIIKIAVWISPMITYIFLQILFCFFKVRGANKYMYEVEKHTRKKVGEINVDDDKFLIYINNIYELMLLTKYLNKLKENAENSKDDIENYMYHKENLEDVITNNTKLSKLMKFNIVHENSPLKNIPLMISDSEMDNDLYCPLLYTNSNSKKYISINSSHNEKLTSELLNFVDNITSKYDEVYDEWN